MKTNVMKKLSSLVLALAIAFTAVFVSVPTVEAATTDKLVATTGDGYATATANAEVKIPFTITSNTEVDFYLFTLAPTQVSVALYNSAGALVSETNNPCTLTSSDYLASEDLGLTAGYYVTGDVWYSLPAGDYTWGLTFVSNTTYAVDIYQVGEAAAISQKTATITKGFTKTLSVSNGTVKKWSSSNTKIAKVTQKGKVTAVKAGSCTIKATLTDGTTLSCKVTVKANKYTATKITTSMVSSGAFGFEAYSASYDSSGNLVVKVRLANNSNKKISKLKNIKVTVKNAKGNTIGTYSLSSKSVSISAYSTKSFSFTIKKSALKKKTTQDLRNATVTTDVNAYYYYYY